MTREEILAMEPGRELDALIEQHVFGKKVEWIQDEVTDHYPIVPAEYGYIVENYSTDISAAWEVVEKMKQNNWFFILSDNLFPDKWEASFFWDPNQEMIDSISNSAPEAICKAALLAVLGEEEA